MSTWDNKKSEKYIDDYISNYCEIDSSGSKGWCVTIKGLCFHFTKTFQCRIGKKSFSAYINNNYPDVIRRQKRIPVLIDGNVEMKREIVLCNLILKEKIESFEKYYEQKKEEKIEERKNEKVIKISGFSHDFLKSLRIGEYKTMSEKIEIILESYLDK